MFEGINEERILACIDNEEELTEQELRNLIWDYQVDSIEGDDRRWSKSMTTIIKLNGRFFSIDWDKGLTEYQENEYWSQVPKEVKKIKKVIEVERWVNIEEKDV